MLGRSAPFRWTLTPPSGTLPDASAIKATAHYIQRLRPASAADERVLKAIPPSPPAGQNAVSDLPFLSASNGWGPVERDTNVGDQAAGDGEPISIAGTGYAKGLGTNSVSDVQLYLAGTCTRLTAQVGVDDDAGGGGTVTFSVVADGKVLTTTQTISGKQAAVPIDVDVTGAQVLDLKVGDAGDGNGWDHGDWGAPIVTCG